MSQTANQGDDLARSSEATDEGGARELTPIKMWGKGTSGPRKEDLYDFAPKTQEQIADESEGKGDESPDPKDSSAPVSAVAAYYEQVKTVLPETQEEPQGEPQQEPSQPENESSESQGTPAPADKVSTPPKPPESGSQTSSDKTKSGSAKQPA